MACLVLGALRVCGKRVVKDILEGIEFLEDDLRLRAEDDLPVTVEESVTCQVVGGGVIGPGNMPETDAAGVTEDFLELIQE